MNNVHVGILKVTLAPPADLRLEAARLTTEADEVEVGAARLRNDAVSRLVEAGMILAARPGEWLPDNPAAKFQVAAATEAIARVDELGAEEGKTPRPRFPGLGRRREEAPEARAERDQRAGQLRLVLAELGRSFGGALGAVSATQQRALEMQAKAEQDLLRASEMRVEAEQLLAEAGARDLAVSELGFDAPLLAATLQETPPTALRSPLQLHPAEVAYIVEPAELAREKALARPGPGAAPDLPLPVAGISFVIGTARRQPIPRDGLSMLGPGEVVVTGSRLGFVGKLKSFAFPLTDLVRVEKYNDGLSLLREGRDNADVVLSRDAGKILFYINYALSRQGTGGS